MRRALLGLTLCLAACAPAPEPARNLLLITIDTLRADRLGAWGYADPTSPVIDSLGAQSVVFLDARSPSSWTLPSLASLMTSLHSSTHRCWKFRSRLGDGYLTLAERLQAAGFATAAVGSHTYLHPKFGLSQGFDEYDQELIYEATLASHMAISSPAVSAKGVRWLESRPDDGSRWFLWLHYFDPHALYLAHEGISERFGTERPSDLYDGEIAFTDRALAPVLAALAARGDGGRTLVVLTADHGEEFGEHGGEQHGHHLYREVVHVPLLIRAPGYAPRRVEAPVQTLDVLPTVLELLGLPAPEDAEGQSLVPAMRGRRPPGDPLLSEVNLYEGWVSLSEGRWKLVRSMDGGAARLYDDEADPEELRDVAREHPRVVAHLRVELDRRVAAARAKAADYGPSAPAELDPDEIRALEALGYIEPGAD